MPLVRLSISNLRNISDIDMVPGPNINLIVGPNGSGKTSILESIYLLGSQRSFRTSKLRTLIKNGCQRCTVHGQMQTGKCSPTVSMGVMRDMTGGQQIKIAGEKTASSASLAQLMPVQVVNPGVFKLIDGPSKARRQFIDWGVFHVEQPFLSSWRRLNRCLKQRNTTLRHDRIDTLEIGAWDREFIACGEKITRYRASYTDELTPLFNQVLAQITKLSGITLAFYPGWDPKISLDQVLKRALPRDKSLGYTQHGPHRADLKIHFYGKNAGIFLSRGEQKMVVAALKIAQGLHFNAATGRKCIYLIDDLGAELDNAHKSAVVKLLAEIGSQVFITAVDEEAAKYNGLSAEIPLFHVEQGRLLENPLNIKSLLEQ